MEEINHSYSKNKKRRVIIIALLRHLNNIQFFFPVSGKDDWEQFFIFVPQRFCKGEMPEWSNGPDSKSGDLLNAGPGVRIPLSPHIN